jgi:glycosyltransferase involved in cell wall biosynthesis
VFDSGSTDDTALKAERLGARVVHYKHNSFARLRTEALKYVTTEWVLYIDADERITPTLGKEIAVTVETADYAAVRFKRSNIFFGKELHHGGWQNDVVTRLFKKSQLVKWFGDIHESPEFTGAVGECKTPLIHFSHRSIRDGLYKSAQWTFMEAQLLYEAAIPPVTFWTLARKGIMEFVRRAFFKKGYKDGPVGIMEAVIQGINKVLVYAQVWELQQKPPIEKKYSEYELELQRLWQDTEEL